MEQGASEIIDLCQFSNGFDSTAIYAVTHANHGTITLFPDGHTVLFKPDSAFLGLANFQYTVNDTDAVMNEMVQVLVGTDPTLAVDKHESSAPRKIILYQNYPNPFNPETQIKYELPSTSKIKLDIFDSLGKNIITLVNQIQAAGTYTVQWSSRDRKGNRVPSGVYFYRIQTETGIYTFTNTKKMLLLE